MYASFEKVNNIGYSSLLYMKHFVNLYNLLPWLHNFSY